MIDVPDQENPCMYYCTYYIYISYKCNEKLRLKLWVKEFPNFKVFLNIKKWYNARPQPPPDLDAGHDMAHRT